MMCDLIYAAESALFGQPEIKLGVIPGIGGTHRLTRLVGRAKAMDLILTGRMMDALEAERAGLVARVMPDETLLEYTLVIAKVIASYSKPSVSVTKEAIDRAEQVPLKEWAVV
jgi:enoyl-CoA hydratase